MDLSLLINLDIDTKIRKALKRISLFLRSGNTSDKLENIEKAIQYLEDIRKELEETDGIL